MSTRLATATSHSGSAFGPKRKDLIRIEDRILLPLA